MLRNSELKLAVEDAIRKNIKRCGEEGWYREDIEESIRAMGGDEEDVLEAIFIGMQRILGYEVERCGTRKRENIN